MNVSAKVIFRQLHMEKKKCTLQCVCFPLPLHPVNYCQIGVEQEIICTNLSSTSFSTGCSFVRDSYHGSLFFLFFLHGAGSAGLTLFFNLMP